MTTMHDGQTPAQPARERRHPGFTRRLTDHSAMEHHPAVSQPVRILLINGAPRCDGSWSGEAALTWRLTDLVRELLQAEGAETEVLDLGLMPGAAELDAVRAQIRANWTATHGVILLAPADGSAAQALLEHGLPSHQSGNGAYGMVIHGEPARVAAARSSLADWFDGTGLVDSDSFGPLTSYAGYVECDGVAGEMPPVPDYEEEARNVARAVLKAVTDLRAGRLAGVKPPVRS